jgi:hypothetical protein
VHSTSERMVYTRLENHAMACLSSMHLVRWTRYPALVFDPTHCVGLVRWSLVVNVSRDWRARWDAEMERGML